MARDGREARRRVLALHHYVDLPSLLRSTNSDPRATILLESGLMGVGIRTG